MKAILKINGKEIEVEVSEDQIEKMTKKKNPFERVAICQKYFYIGILGDIGTFTERNDANDKLAYSIANYCTDKDLIQQQAWRETLNRLLWRWQYENDEPIKWQTLTDQKFAIHYDFVDEEFFVCVFYGSYKSGDVHFTTKEKAEQAIEEVVKPFMAEHPDFVW